MTISLYSWSRENAKSVDCLTLMLLRFLRALVNKTEVKIRYDADRTRSSRTTTARHLGFQVFSNCIGKASNDRFSELKFLESVYGKS